jgi:hypothetical protein
MLRWARAAARGDEIMDALTTVLAIELTAGVDDSTSSMSSTCATERYMMIIIFLAD